MEKFTAILQIASNFSSVFIAGALMVFMGIEFFDEKKRKSDNYL